jgi:hypothetical protein
MAFETGETRIASVSLAVTPAGLPCALNVYLGLSEDAPVSYGQTGFTSSGVSQQVQVSVPMPAAPGTYHVYLDLYVGGELFRQYQALGDVEVAEPYPIEFTGFTVSPFTIKADSGWWGVSYYAVSWHQIRWYASQRVPEGETGSANIRVQFQYKSGSTVIASGSYTTTPQTVQPSGSGYYFPVGSGAVGQPYAGASLSLGSTKPPTGTWTYTMTVTADVGGVVKGMAVFEGTVQVT